MNETKSIVAHKIADMHFTGNYRLSPIVDRGTCNFVFKAVSKNEKVIIRFNKDRDPQEFLKEHWCMQKAIDEGVSVARPVAIGNMLGYQYSVQSYEGEIHGEDISDRLLVWRFLGQSAAKFHHIDLRGFGERLVDSKKSQFDGNWRKYLHENVGAWKQTSLFDEITPVQKAKIAILFDGLSKADLQIGLCHGDLCPRNVVSNETGVLAIIDWGCAHAHIVPHYDFIELLREHERDSAEVKAFIDGYGLQDKNDFFDEVESLLLLCHFDLVRWARDRNPDELPQKRKDFLALANRFI
jgi:Ser/Thr protein kinase RdoA (MazF antagonist)